MRIVHAVACLAALAPLSSPSPPSSPARRVLRLRYGPADRERNRYQYVPIPVPPGTTRLTLSYAYDKAGGANALDLGLFEPGPLEIGTRAFRGWSGGARPEVTVALDEASPGYWPGPLPPGKWHVALGLYKVAAEGVDVTLTSETSSAPAPRPVPSLAPRPPGPLRAGPAWYSGGVHLHTVHSDGGYTTAEVCRRAREAGLDFVILTDHDNTTHQLDPVDEPGLLRIVGEEVTTPGGHAGVWGLGGWRDDVDFRIMPGDPRLAALVRAVTSRGALFVINHPKAECLGCSWEHAVPEGVAAIEIANGSPAERQEQMARWDSLLREGRHLAGLASSDWHRPDHPIDAGSVRVWARELSQAAILEAFRAGRVVAMADGRTPPPVLVARAGSAEAAVGDTLTVGAGRPVVVEVTTPEAMAGARVDLVWNGEAVASARAEAGRSARFERAVDRDGYLRAHVSTAEGGPVAVTSPIYLKVGAGK